MYDFGYGLPQNESDDRMRLVSNVPANNAGELGKERYNLATCFYTGSGRQQDVDKAISHISHIDRYDLHNPTRKMRSRPN